jgi:hypothetical protein
MRLTMSFLDAVSKVSGILSKVSGRTSRRPQIYLFPTLVQRHLGTVREPLHECREQVVRRFCGEVLS